MHRLANELKLLQDNLAYHRDYFASDVGKAQTLLQEGETRADASLAPQELAAYASVASLMLNLDEAITIQ